MLDRPWNADPDAEQWDAAGCRRLEQCCAVGEDHVEKVVRSAVANATEQDVSPKRNALYVKACWVDEGPTIKRFQPKDRGTAYSIMKRTSHLVVEVDERA